jgi:hypothetical protein
MAKQYSVPRLGISNMVPGGHIYEHIQGDECQAYWDAKLLKPTSVTSPKSIKGCYFRCGAKGCRTVTGRPTETRRANQMARHIGAMHVEVAKKALDAAGFPTVEIYS